MAKMYRWKRAWQRFTDEFRGTHRKVGFSGWNTRGYKRSQRAQDEAYWALIRVARDFGIKVYLKPDLGESRDSHGEKFRVGGHWDSRGNAVRMVYRSFPILAHELAHAVDEFLGYRYRKPTGELVASGAGYMLVCASAGLVSPTADVAYAKRQGATERGFEECEERILQVFREMATLI